MSGHLDGPKPPGPPDPPYIEGDLGAPSAEEFARRRGERFVPDGPMSSDVKRWTIRPSHWFGEGDDRGLALGTAEPRPETDSDPFEVVAAADFDRVVAERNALKEALGGVLRADGLLDQPYRGRQPVNEAERAALAAWRRTGDAR